MATSTKQTLSAPFFKTTRVSSCQYVVTRNGKTAAVSYPYTKTGWKAPNSWNNQKRSAEVASMSNITYRTGFKCHAGMPTKPLTAYTPNSYRSRLPIADLVMPYKNASTVEIGDRSSYNPASTFRTTNRAQLGAYNLHNYTSNQGIVAERVKWEKRRRQD